MKQTPVGLNLDSIPKGAEGFALIKDYFFALKEKKSCALGKGNMDGPVALISGHPDPFVREAQDMLSKMREIVLQLQRDKILNI